MQRELFRQATRAANTSSSSVCWYVPVNRICRSTHRNLSAGSSQRGVLAVKESDELFGFRKDLARVATARAARA